MLITYLDVLNVFCFWGLFAFLGLAFILGLLFERLIWDACFFRFFVWFIIPSIDYLFAWASVSMVHGDACGVLKWAIKNGHSVFIVHNHVKAKVLKILCFKACICLVISMCVLSLLLACYFNNHNISRTLAVSYTSWSSVELLTSSTVWSKIHNYENFW